MGITTHISNQTALESDLKWLEGFIDRQVRRYFADDASEAIPEAAPLPPIGETASHYGKWLSEFDLSREQRIILLVAIAPHVQPNLLDVFFTKNANYDREFVEFGGVCQGPHQVFYPTVETALFLLTCGDLGQRFELMRHFTVGPLFGPGGILQLSEVRPGCSWASARLDMDRDALFLLTTGLVREPVFNMEFPARKITTELDWADLVLARHTRMEVEEVLGWMQYQNRLLQDWGLGKRIRSGYNALFYGPPGTGKTLCATLLGKASSKPVYRIDLSMVVSKYIGETEKNLSRLFDRAQNQEWILFFDEADALFGKRTEVRDAHDRYANQEVSYLLQRIEEFEGVILLASNKRQNFDETFSRRFQSVIHFPMPDKDLRLDLWQKAIPKELELDRGMSMQALAEQHELAGGSIINVIRYAALKAAMAGSEVLKLRDLQEGIRRELGKEGKTI